jgi:hypothetical protein
MFDGQFHFLGSFTDPNVSLQSPGHPGAWQVDDAPNGRLFVLDTLATGPSGTYGGIVDIFDTDGHLLTPNHFAANGLGAGPLESPWGITQAPADWGAFSNDILIGNDEGPGYINAFDPTTGAFLGHLTHPDGTPIAIPGLWYLTFGGGTPQTGLTKQLYFDAGPSLEVNTGQGLFGRIIAAGQAGERGGVSTPSSPDAASAAGTAGPGSTMQGPALAPMSPVLIESLSQSTGPQDTSSAGQPSSLQLPASNVSSSVTGQQAVLLPASAGDPILPTGKSQITTDVLDGLFVGLGNSAADVLSEGGL